MINIGWDYDTLHNSLRRGFNTAYNFYAIFLETQKPVKVRNLFYIGSTRMDTASGRLLNGHEGLQDALQMYSGTIQIALGQWIDFQYNSLKQSNEGVRYIEAALINQLDPIKNVINQHNYDGPPITIGNHIRSYGGLDLHRLVRDNIFDSFDDLQFSSLILDKVNTIEDYYYADNPLEMSDILMILGEIEKTLDTLNTEIQISQ